MFYDNFIRLCNAKGKSPSHVAEELGIYKSTVTGWKNGRKVRGNNAIKIADYFGISVGELLNDEIGAKKAAPISESGSDRKLELINLISGLDDEDMQRVYKILRAVIDE